MKKFLVIAALSLTLGGCNAAAYSTHHHRRPVASVYVPPHVYVAPRPQFIYRQHYTQPYSYRVYQHRPHYRPHYYHYRRY